MNRYSHIDLRVTSFQDALPFYKRLLPALGFTRRFDTAQWKVFAADGDLPEASYFAIAEDPDHKPNETLVGFCAMDRDEVDRLGSLVKEAGGRNVDGPRLFPISPTYYAVFFEDPSGNKFEIVNRLN